MDKCRNFYLIDLEAIAEGKGVISIVITIIRGGVVVTHTLGNFPMIEVYFGMEMVTKNSEAESYTKVKVSPGCDSSSAG